MNDDKQIDTVSRRKVLTGGAQALAAIAVVVIGVKPAFSKGKSAKEDFFFQETPDEDTGRKSTGQFGADSGDCALLIGDVCTHCYCQGWTDKNAPGAKKAGT
jgi:hypothetical protein